MGKVSTIGSFNKYESISKGKEVLVFCFWLTVLNSVVAFGVVISKEGTLVVKVVKSMSRIGSEYW